MFVLSINIAGADTADKRRAISVGVIEIGVGNGDPNCHESDKEPRRSLFNGLAQVIVQSTKAVGTITIEASTVVRNSTVAPAKIEIATKQVELKVSVA